jgi:hypothetical protein
MTNEQALGRALELLMQVVSMDSTGDICYGPAQGLFAENTPMWDRLVSDIDKFLDSELRREE